MKLDAVKMVLRSWLVPAVPLCDGEKGKGGTV